MTRLVFRLAFVVSSLSFMTLALTRLIDRPSGNAQRGEVLYMGASSPYLPCFQCHQLPKIAPGMKNLSRRIAQERLTVPTNAGETVEEYLVESIIDPQRYLVPNYSDIMPAFKSHGFAWFRAANVQELQDLVAYLMTL